MSFGLKPIDIQEVVQAARAGAPGAAELLMSQMQKAVTDGVPGAEDFLAELQPEGLCVRRREVEAVIYVLRELGWND
jgi:hypothetical protein